MKNILGMVMVLVMGGIMASAASPARKVFAGGGTTQSNLSYYVVSANGIGVPVINFLSVKTDKDAGKATFYTLAVATSISGTTASGAAAITNMVSTNWIDTANEYIVIRDVSGDVYQLSQAMIGMSGGPQVTLTNTASATADTLDFATAAGDLIYTVTASGTLDIANLTAAYASNVSTEYSNASGIYAGSDGSLPILIIVDGTTNHAVNVISGEYK